MKFRDLIKLTKNERKDKINELQMELIKSNATKTGKKIKQIKKMIARLKTIESKQKDDKK